MGVQGCRVPLELSTLSPLDVEMRSRDPAALGEAVLLPSSHLSECCQLPCWRVLSCASELFRTSYARGKRGLNLVLFRFVILKVHSPWEVRAVSQPGCSLSCSSCCSLPRSWYFEVLQRPAFSPATGKMFFLCVVPSSFPSRLLLMALLLP